MEEEKTPKQKPHTSFNRLLSVAKNPEGNMTIAKEIVKNFILGEHGKGYNGNYLTNENMNKFVIILKWINNKNRKLKKEILRNLKTQWLLKNFSLS